MMPTETTSARLWRRLAPAIGACWLLLVSLAVPVAAQQSGSGPEAAESSGPRAAVSSRTAESPRAVESPLASDSPDGSPSGSDEIRNPVDVVAMLHDALVIAAAAGESRDERYGRLLPVVRATHDLAYIAELTIRRQWRDLPEADRERFVTAFEQLSVMTYASRFADIGADSFRIEGMDTLDDDRVQVRSTIGPSDADRVSLDYVLHRQGADWRIINILADGVSDLALKRAQYQGIFRGGGSIDAVIDEIVQATAAL